LLLSGLCGNYNDVQEDDFKTESGITEGTPTTFVNLWTKNLYSCTDVKNTFFPENPCSLISETGTQFYKHYTTLIQHALIKGFWENIKIVHSINRGFVFPFLIFLIHVIWDTRGQGQDRVKIQLY